VDPFLFCKILEYPQILGHTEEQDNPIIY